MPKAESKVEKVAPVEEPKVEPLTPEAVVDGFLALEGTAAFAAAEFPDGDLVDLIKAHLMNLEAAIAGLKAAVAQRGAMGR